MKSVIARKRLSDKFRTKLGNRHDRLAIAAIALLFSAFGDVLQRRIGVNDDTNGNSSGSEGEAIAPRRGVVFACSNARWIHETLFSVESFRRQMPDLDREIYVSPELYQQYKPDMERLCTAVVVLEASEHPTRPRFDACFQTCLEQALFIDGDTMLLEPVPELFDLLDHFDVALAAAPQYLSPPALRLGIFKMLPPVSEALPEWNTGVLAAKVTPGFRSMVRNWSDLYTLTKRHGFDMDQASFRSAAANSGLRIATLAANYNFRANMPQAVTRRVKILHAHGDLAKIAATINLQTGVRIYTPNRDDIYGFKPRVPEEGTSPER